MESLVPFVTENLRSALWFQPELALTFGTLVLFVIDLFWRRSAARVAYLTAGALAVLGVTAVLLARQPADGQALFNGMIANDAYCVDVLLQIAAVQGALDQVRKLLLGRHIESCVAEALRSGSRGERQRKVEELLDVFSRFGGS